MSPSSSSLGEQTMETLNLDPSVRLRESTSIASSSTDPPLDPPVPSPFQHTLHVQVPTPSENTFNMSLCVNISTTHSPPSTNSSSSSAVIVPMNKTSTPIPSRKRKGIKKDTLTLEESPKSPFEKLNTLKLLLENGHLTTEEYQERKTQIINEMTGTSRGERKNEFSLLRNKRLSPLATLQPLMNTVVPHPPPDFSRLRKERAEKLSLDVDTLEWHSTSTRIKLDLVPFATGQLRNAYFLQECGHENNGNVPRLLVAKFSRRPVDPSAYINDVEMQAVCAHYAALYNEHEPPLKVYYARSWLLQLKDRTALNSKTKMICSMEEYLPGAYVKYSNNHGYVGKETSTTQERERNTPHAFSHFSFVASDYQLMIVDIQGVDDAYTDPQIHTVDGRGFGAGNLGTYGMESFLATHRCNAVCQWLGLKSLNQEYKVGGTAAPLYEMPFGWGCIKKSTTRITEERTRTRTVSDVLTFQEGMEGENEEGRKGGTGENKSVPSKTCATTAAITSTSSTSSSFTSSPVHGMKIGLKIRLWRIVHQLACGCCE